MTLDLGSSTAETLLSPINEDGDGSDPEDEGDHDISFYPGSEGKGNIMTFKGTVSPQPARGLPSFNYKYLNRNVRDFVLLQTS